MWLDKFERELGFIVLQTNREMRRYDTNKLSRDELTRQLEAGDRDYHTTERKTSWDGETLIVEWGPPMTARVTVGNIDINRVLGKVRQASGVVGRVVTHVESQADSVIGREDEITKKATSAFAPHNDLLDQANSELDRVSDALNLLGNGGPALDPLHESVPAVKGS